MMAEDFWDSHAWEGVFGRLVDALQGGEST